jgi:hypothetical protein
MSTLPFSRECLLTAITGRTTPEQAALHAAQDDVGEWATQHAANLRAGVADARVYDLAERERKQRLLESAQHLLHAKEGFARVDPARCQWCPGTSECGYPRCLEMACTAGDDNLPPVRPAKWLGVAVILVLACIGAGALTSYFGG